MDVTPHMRGQYLNADEVKTGDIVVIKNETRLKKGYGGKDVLAVDVVLADDTELEATLNQKSVKNLAEAWGTESKNWIGREALITIEETDITDKETKETKTVKVIYFEPNEDVPVGTGPDVKQEDIPVIEPEKKEET